MGLLDQASSFATTLAEQQTALNQATAQQEASLNRVNQITPYGSTTYQQDPTTGQYTQTVGLSPEQQALYNQQMGAGQSLLGQAAGNFAQPISYDGLTALPRADMAGRNAIANELYGAQVGQIDKAYDRAFEGLQQNLANRGVGYGNVENIQRTFDDFTGSWGDVYNNAWSGALEQATQDQALMYDQALLGRQQDISELESQYYNPLNAYNVLMGGGAMTPSAAASALGSSNTPSVNLANTDIMGPASNFFSTLQSGENAAASAGASIQAAQIAADAANNRLNTQIGANNISDQVDILLAQGRVDEALALSGYGG